VCKQQCLRCCQTQTVLERMAALAAVLISFMPCGPVHVRVIVVSPCVAQLLIPVTRSQMVSVLFAVADSLCPSLS
jgi:hypothetical protein